MRFVVRPKLSPDAAKGSGAEGASGAVVYAETAAKARQTGAQRLGLPEGRVTVEQMDDAPPVITGPDRPLTKEEAAEIFNQPTTVKPGSWESI